MSRSVSECKRCCFCTHVPHLPAFFYVSCVSQKTMERGINKFNVNPKDGIAYLIENGLISDTAESICDFLSTGEGLSKRRIGEFFGRVRLEATRVDRSTRNEGSIPLFSTQVLFSV